MARRYYRCRNRACGRPDTVLGRITSDHGLVLDPAVTSFRVFLDVRRAEIACPVCGAVRDFRGPFVCTNW